mgnify:CR=1 FL=1
MGVKGCEYQAAGRSGGPREIRAHSAHCSSHLSNLIKVSEFVVVRHDAGRALLRLAPLLTPDQRNEIAVELLKGLEVGEYEFSKYIPEYLGQLSLWLPPEQLEEVLSYLRGLMANANDRVVSVALDTVGVLTEYYPCYQERFEEDEKERESRLGRLLGMVLGGLANHRETVRQEALLVTGQYIFGSKRLSDHEKMKIFALSHKKLLFLINENRGGGADRLLQGISALQHLPVHHGLPPDNRRDAD